MMIENKKKSAIFVQGISKNVREFEIQQLLNDLKIFCLKIPKDSNRENYGYAIISFNSIQEAESATNILRYKKLHNRTLRVTWYNRTIFREREKDPNFNIFLKNLNKTISLKELDTEFKKYGDIISSKIQEDEEGDSLGYGFIQYYQKENVDKAIEDKNGQNWKDKKIYAAKLIKNKPRNIRFNNIYLKNIPKDLPEEKLLNFFSKFGEISKYIFKNIDENNDLPKFSENKIEHILKNKFGFICFKEFEPAMNAVKAVPYMDIFNEEINTKLFNSVKILLEKGFNNWEESYEKIEIQRKNGKEKYEEKKLMNVYEFADYLNGINNLTKDISNYESSDFIEKLKEFKENKIEINDDKIDKIKNTEKIFCCQALKKKERLRKVKENFEKNKKLMQKKYEYCNLYIKNLDKNITEDKFRDMFLKFGPLRSYKLSEKKFRNSLFNKNESSFLYGFVCFENEKDALNAKKALNKTFYYSTLARPLYVDYHQVKKEREIILRNKRINYINRFILGKDSENINNIRNNQINDNIDVHDSNIHQVMLTPETRINFSYKSPICTLLQNSDGAFSINKDLYNSHVYHFKEENTKENIK